jgi:hypothetical protein
VLVDPVAALPSQFDAFRNPISGQVGGCVASLRAAAASRLRSHGQLGGVPQPRHRRSYS